MNTNTKKPALPMLKRRHLLIGAAAGIAQLGVGTAAAQSFPAKPIKIIVPFAAGAGTDAMGRLLALKMGEQLGVSITVENRTGASGAIGTAAVAQSPADGYTLLLIAAPFTTVPAALPSAGYDPIAQFTPIGMVASGPLLWAANKDLPVSNLRELVALAKTKPGVLNYGSAGSGGINHLVLEMLKARTGTFITHIPYRGVAPAVTDMIGGQIQVVTGTVPALAPFIRDGRIKALAVTSERRTAALPEVPNMVESGLAGFNVLNYFGLVAPKGTPADVVARLNAAVAKVVTLPDVLTRFATDAIEPNAGTPAQLAQFIEGDYKGWQQVVAQQKLKIDSL